MSSAIELYTQTEAAKILGVDVATLCRWRKKKMITARKRGRWVRYTAEDLQTFIDASREQAEARPDNRRAKINQKGS